jgi:hypothetical protein
MILYLDTSALVKRYVVESESKEVNTLIESADTVGSAMLTQVEMASAFAKAVCMNWVEADIEKIVWQDFHSHWHSFARLSVTPALVEYASRLPRNMDCAVTMLLTWLQRTRAGDTGDACHAGHFRLRIMAGGKRGRSGSLAGRFIRLKQKAVGRGWMVLWKPMTDFRKGLAWDRSDGLRGLRKRGGVAVISLVYAITAP